MDQDARISASTEQVSCDLDGDTVILNLKNSTYYELNPVAARVWELLQQPATVGELHLAIVDEYEVSADQAMSDLQALLEDLKRHELLIIHDGADASISTR